MASSMHSPLSQACIRALSDKLYEKRKSAALEVEKLVRDAVQAGNQTHIVLVVKVLDDHTTAANPHIKKGGLVGLAAVAAGLGTQHCSNHLVVVMKPILACLCDNNGSVRYHAAESLYNVVRVARHNIMPVFGDLFTAVSSLATDLDPNVRVGSDMLDTTMKDVVKECGAAVDLSAIIPVMKPKLYTTNSTLQTLLVSWLAVLHAMPTLDLVPVLAEVLDPVLLILTSPHQEVVRATDNLLMSLLESCRDHSESVDCLLLAPQLVQHAQSHNTTLKNMALCWLNELLTLGGRDLLPHAAPILAASLPSMAQPAASKSRKVAEEVSNKIMGLLEPIDDVIPPTVVPDTADASSTAQNGQSTMSCRVDLSSVVCVLLKHLTGDSEQCKVIALHWLHHLLKNFPNLMRGEMECLCRDMMPVLSDPSESVVVMVLSLLATIAGATPETDSVAAGSASSGASSSAYFRRVLRLLVDFLVNKIDLLENRGPLILRELCSLLSPVEVYVCLSSLLQEDGGTVLPPLFMSSVARIMATILITSRELFPLRLELRNLRTKESCEVFVSLFRCWTHSPVSVVLLCLLSQSYEQAAALVPMLAEAEVTVDFLVEVDKLVQLLESPIFTYLRLDLLNNDRASKALVKTLYGLLMIIPQSATYTTLATRLSNLPPPHRLEDPSDDEVARLQMAEDTSEKRNIDFDGLLDHFRRVQEKKKKDSQDMVRNELQKISDGMTTLIN